MRGWVLVGVLARFKVLSRASVLDLFPQDLTPALIRPTLMLFICSKSCRKEGLDALEQLGLCLQTLTFASIVVLEDAVQGEAVTMATKNALKIVTFNMNVTWLIE